MPADAIRTSALRPTAPVRRRPLHVGSTPGSRRAPQVSTSAKCQTRTNEVSHRHGTSVGDASVIRRRSLEARRYGCQHDPTQGRGDLAALYVLYGTSDALAQSQANVPAVRGKTG